LTLHKIYIGKLSDNLGIQVGQGFLNIFNRVINTFGYHTRESYVNRD